MDNGRESEMSEYPITTYFNPFILCPQLQGICSVANQHGEGYIQFEQSELGNLKRLVTENIHKLGITVMWI